MYSYEKFIRRIPHKYFPSFQDYVNLAEFAFCLIGEVNEFGEKIKEVDGSEDK